MCLCVYSVDHHLAMALKRGAKTRGSEQRPVVGDVNVTNSGNTIPECLFNSLFQVVNDHNHTSPNHKVSLISDLVIFPLHPFFVAAQ